MDAPLSRPPLAASPSRTSSATVDLAVTAVGRFVPWLDGFGDLSHDPYDLWATRLGKAAKTAYYRHGLAGKLAAAPFVALDTGVPRSRYLVCAKRRSPIADAHYAMGFSALARAQSDQRFEERADSFRTALRRSRSPGFSDPAWGYPFDWATRYFVIPAGWPLITTIPYCFEAFLDEVDSSGEPLDDAMLYGIARFAAEQIPVTAVATGAASAYTPSDRRQVVNASAYRGFLLLSAGTRFERQDWIESGLENIRFVVGSQRPDGSWPYSMDGADDFVDNFHTCLVLKNLVKSETVHPSEGVGESIRRGYRFYLEHLLDGSGLPLPFADRPRPTFHRADLYDYAEGINLALLLRRDIVEAPAVLDRLVADLVGRWQLPDGHFVTRVMAKGRRNTVPYHRWAQSQTFRALAMLVEATV